MHPDDLGAYDPMAPVPDRIKAVYGLSRAHFDRTQRALRDLAALHPGQALVNAINHDMELLQDIEYIGKNGYEMTSSNEDRLIVLQRMASTEPRASITYAADKMVRIRHALRDIAIISEKLDCDISLLRRWAMD